MPTVHLVISGKVQGVYFRASAKETALALGIKGTVRNTREGNVEIVATGTPEKIRDFISWCYEGPPGAQVQDIAITALAEISFPDFSIVR